ncbi:MAG: hypothetical protein AAFR35_07820 [Pseudomonadota bacterium]
MTPASPLRHAMRRPIARRPVLYGAVARLTGNTQFVRSRTDLVIDGFPRSANSTTEAAFHVAEGADHGYRLAHHTHAPAQFLQAVRFGCPAVLLLREPDAAILSWKEAHGTGMTFATLYEDWLAFHRPLTGIGAHVVVAPFTLVIRDYGAVAAAVNAKFGTRFRCPAPSPAFAEAVARKRDRISYARTGHAPRYSSDRDTAFHARRMAERARLRDAQAAPELATLRAAARALHGELRAAAMPDPDAAAPRGLPCPRQERMTNA